MLFQPQEYAQNPLVLGAGAVVLPLVAFVLYRLFLSPLAKFPGPKIAALTGLYEYYWEQVQYYDYIWKVKAMHRQYGPIVRINPREVHIDDPEFFDTLNSFRGAWNKDPSTALQFAGPDSTVGTVDHELHKKRRQAMMPFYAKQKIYALEPVVQSMVDKLCNRFDDYLKAGQVVPMRWAFKCFSNDTVAEYCFARNSGMMDSPDFMVSHFAKYSKGLDAGLSTRYLPASWFKGMKKAPEFIRKAIDNTGGSQHLEIWHDDMKDHVTDVEAKRQQLESGDITGHRTIFHEILNSPAIPPSEKSTQRIIQEGGAQVGAGGESTSQVLAVAVLMLLQNPDKLEKLRAELKAAKVEDSTGKISLRTLEGLPYLTGVVKEAFRMRTGKIARHQRIPVGRSLMYKNYEIPAGTCVSMTPAYVHLDESIFPDPFSFKPERWCDISDAERGRLERFWVPFSKGTRMCSGANLAVAEVFMCIPAVMTRFDMDLYESSAWDCEMAVDYEKHASVKGSKGLRVTLKKSTY